ncbi:MAG: L-serine ammonia-lyase, iron-sulfur-dependent, subunit alpha [Clostridia bacterium]|nr:L-serine ammonia-lyase, iron-sulfur-dependent, subunit alpha [Clostridia bacterium]
MQSLRELYKIGKGPSSSHTMAPFKASRLFKEENPDADSFKAILYGSLAKTGKGHHTDEAIIEGFDGVKTELVFDVTTEDLPHENTVDFFAYKNGEEIGKMRVMSIGGGDFAIEGRPHVVPQEVYKENTFAEIAKYCKKHKIRISDYVYQNEGEEIKEFLAEVWSAMKDCVNEGLLTDGILDGGLRVERKARFLLDQQHIDESEITYENRMVCAYAFAVGEQNAGGGIVVTAPTCGASSVLPAVLKYMQEKKRFSDRKIIDALAVAGIIGILVKTNASVSGAECGCQAEMGTACSMAAAALAEIFGMRIEQIEYAAEVAMEHHLGLTCDPIAGLVQIPCIERGAIAAMRAINALNLANFLSSTRKISFDLVVETMYETGKDLKFHYRETSEGGLAKLYLKRKK